MIELIIFLLAFVLHPVNCLACPENFVCEDCNECVTCFYTQNCFVACLSEHCLNNTSDNKTGHCNLCTNGQLRNLCNENCSMGCRNASCDMFSGDCLLCCDDSVSNDTFCVINNNYSEWFSTTDNITCTPGFYGEDCNQTCESGCDGACEKISGLCQSCKRNRYGSHCNSTCSTNCLAKGNLSTCNETSGHCYMGCIDGFYGDMCESVCKQTCNDKYCDHTTGTCTQGSTVDSLILSIVVPVVGAVACFVIIITIVLGIWRCKTRKNHAAPYVNSDDRYATVHDLEVKAGDVQTETAHTRKGACTPYETLTTATRNDYDTIAHTNTVYANTVI